MNILLLEHEQINNSLATVSGEKARHISNILKLKVGDSLRVGIINGKIGKGEIINIEEDEVKLLIQCDTLPPDAIDITIILAMPRPKALRRILKTIASLGIKQIYLINCFKVEKSYWQTPLLSDTNVRQAFIQGLEQSKDSIMPQINIRKLFKPFIEDELSMISNNKLKLLAHPEGGVLCPANITQPMILAFGPEGGFTKFEVSQFINEDFKQIHLGERILNIETAIPFTIGKLSRF